jgi:hypothetical protein
MIWMRNKKKMKIPENPFPNKSVLIHPQKA